MLAVCVSAQYFATTMVIVGLSVIATVLVLQYHHHDPDGGHMPQWVSLSSSSSTVQYVQYKQYSMYSTVYTVQYIQYSM